MHVFYFDINGVIAHFRDSTSHLFHNSYVSPPPHTIAGLLGACCGATQTQVKEEILPHLYLSCRIDYIGGMLKDISLLTTIKDENSKVPRMRRFLVDARYRIYVGCDDSKLCQKLYHAVKNPVFVPYLGISDCISCIRKVSKIFNSSKTRIQKTRCIFEMSDNMQITKKIQSESRLSRFEVINCPILYGFDDDGSRMPSKYKQVALPLNYSIEFKKPILGHVIEGEPVCLIGMYGN